MQGTLRRLEDDTVDKKAEAVALFSRVSGIGPIAAHEFVDSNILRHQELTSGGLLTLDDLRQQSDLTPQQTIGLKYFEELELKIPREEMDIWNVFSFWSSNSDNRLPSRPPLEPLIQIFNAPLLDNSIIRAMTS